MTTFICSGLLMAAQGPAQAENLSFKPVSDWSVSRMGEGDRAYCALTRSFSGDAVLTFARNGAGKNSLALDLNKKLFKPAATFETKMASGGFNASYPAKAISDRAAMIGMGQKADIFDSMTRSDSLRVTLEGNQYAFDLAGFASGRQSLDSCLENGGSIDINAPVADPAKASAQLASAVKAAQ